MLSAGADTEAAVTALKPYAAGSIEPGGGERNLLLTVPVTVSDGLTTTIVRALDAAGVQVTDVSVRRASLDDVFFSLTGRRAAQDRATEGSVTP
jgi:hypothetical protein